VPPPATRPRCRPQTNMPWRSPRKRLPTPGSTPTRA
jgi:hypothetical protein